MWRKLDFLPLKPSAPKPSSSPIHLRVALFTKELLQLYQEQEQEILSLNFKTSIKSEQNLCKWRKLDFLPSAPKASSSPIHPRVALITDSTLQNHQEQEQEIIRLNY